MGLEARARNGRALYATRINGPIYTMAAEDPEGVPGGFRLTIRCPSDQRRRTCADGDELFYPRGAIGGNHLPRQDRITGAGPN